jgi:hypothetical protein
MLVLAGWGMPIGQSIATQLRCQAAFAIAQKSFAFQADLGAGIASLALLC